MGSTLCHFIQCHKDLEMVSRTVEALMHRSHYLLVHADAMSGDGSFAGDLRARFCRDREVAVMDPVISTYTAWPMVLANLMGMRYALRHYPLWDHYINLCGASMPLGSIEHIAEQFEPGYSYMAVSPPGSPFWNEHVLGRSSQLWGYDELCPERPWSNGPAIPGNPEDRLSHAMGREMHLYGQCPAFAAFSREACEYLVGPECNPIRTFFHVGHCVDEAFYATALMNWDP